jgi:hypothetical protein
MASTAGYGVHRGGNAEGAGLGNRFVQQVDQRVVDARVLDASGREKKLHAASGVITAGENLPGAYGSVRGRDSRITENSSDVAADVVALGPISNGRVLGDGLRPAWLSERFCRAL